MKGRKPIYKLTAVTKKRMLTGIRMNISEPVWLTDGTLVLGLSATSQQYFSLRKPATTNQPAVLFSQNKPAPAISHQPTEQACLSMLGRRQSSRKMHMRMSAMQEI
jgi:hypothetical protein